MLCSITCIMPSSGCAQQIKELNARLRQMAEDKRAIQKDRDRLERMVKSGTPAAPSEGPSQARACPLYVMIEALLCHACRLSTHPVVPVQHPMQYLPWCLPVPAVDIAPQGTCRVRVWDAAHKMPV